MYGRVFLSSEDIRKESERKARLESFRRDLRRSQIVSDFFDSIAAALGIMVIFAASAVILSMFVT